MDLTPSSPLSHEVSIFDESGVNLPCVGSILSSYLILTLANCLHGNGIGKGWNKFSIKTKTKSGNGRNSNSKLEEEQIRRVSQIIFHPDSENDLAILVLSQNLNSSVKILPILNGTANKTTCTNFSGHLCKEDSTLSPLKISEPSQCPFSSAFLCLLPLSFNGKDSSCSRPFPGSSLLCSGEKSGQFLCGILAFSHENVEDRGQIYANITSHLNWIESASKVKINVNDSSELNQRNSAQASFESLPDDFDYEVANYPDYEDPTRKARSVDYGVGPQISHGVRVNKSNPIPYQLSIQYQNPLDGIWRHICGGVILDENTAITAAHCFDKSTDVRRYRVIAGENRLNTFDHEEKVSHLKKITIHLEYMSSTDGNDIAILHVDQPFQFNKYVGEVWLSPFSIAKLANKSAVISGWGKVSEDSGLSNSLQKGNVSILPPEDCQNRLKTRMKLQLQEGVVCALHPLVRTCSGDSGGPLVIQNYTLGNSTGNLLVGITSFGAENCSHVNRVGVFTEISSFYNWIQENRATPLGCGGFIEIDGEDEIVYKVPEELGGEKSICVWVVAAVNASEIEIQLLSNTTTQFQPEESTLFALGFSDRDRKFSETHIWRENETKTVDKNFLLLYFRTTSSARNSGVHIRLKAKDLNRTPRNVTYFELGLEDGAPQTSLTQEFEYPEPPAKGYGNNESTFILVKPGGRHGKLKLDLKSVDTEEKYDWVEILSVESEPVSHFRFSGGGLWYDKIFEAEEDEPFIISFHSDSSNTRAGFQFSYSETRNSGIEKISKRRSRPFARKMVVDQSKNPVPYQLSIQYNGSHHCGGVILDKNTALSAAHCFDPKLLKVPSLNLNHFALVAGEQNLNKNDGTEQVLQIQMVFKHPQFRNYFSGNDIAVIQVKGEFNFTERVNNAWISSQITPNFKDVLVTSTDWGQRERSGNSSVVLQSFELEVMSQSKCKKRWEFLTGSMICGYNRDLNVCRGEGGPLVLKNYVNGPHTTKDLLVGIASFALNDCEKPDQPNGFTNVAHFYKWIAKVRSNSMCSSTEFQCFNGDCIQKELKCDEKYDCADGSDEKMCLSHTRVTPDAKQGETNKTLQLFTVNFFASKNFSGDQVKINVSNTCQEISSEWNDRVSSLNATSCVTFYEGGGCSNHSQQLTGNHSDLSLYDLDNKISSFELCNTTRRREASPLFLTAYESENYKGNSTRLSFECGCLGLKFGWDDRINSVKNPENLCVLGYANERCTGKSVRITSDISSFHSQGLNNTLTTFRICRRTSNCP